MERGVIEAPVEWRQAVETGRLHHAWLITGGAGLGKYEFAQRAAGQLVEAADVRAHPDVDIVRLLPKDEKEEKKRVDGQPFDRKRNITVAQIRSIQARLNARPTLGDKRAVIIEPAEAMERGAANALLKSLEEPPANTFFFLVSHHAARLLPTIRSRCRQLRFARFDDDSLETALTEAMPDLDVASHRAAVANAAGSPAKAIAFAEHKLAPAAELLDRMLNDGGRGLGAELAAALGGRPPREKMAAFFALARARLNRDLAQLNRSALDRRAEVLCELVLLEQEAPVLNYDPGLLVQRVAALLARAAPASEQLR